MVNWDLNKSRTAWWITAIILGGILTLVIYTFIGTFVFAVFIYYATRPVYRRLKRYVKPPSLAAAVALVTLALPALLLFAYTIAIGLQEIERLLIRFDINFLQRLLAPYINISNIVQDPTQFLGQPDTLDAIKSIFFESLSYLGFIGNAALHLFLMIGMAFYLLRDDKRLMKWFHRQFSDQKGVLKMYMNRVDRDFSNIFFGNILNALLTAIIGASVYNIFNYFAPSSVGIPYATLIGLLAGVASLIPVVGMKLVYFPVAGYLIFLAVSQQTRLLWWVALFVVLSFVLVDSIPDFVLRPYVSGRGLHLGMVMFAYIFGPLLWGWYGIFLGPMILVLVAHFVKLVLPELISGQPVRPETIDLMDPNENYQSTFKDHSTDNNNN
ncbi:MAG: AI-2E family transporter [Halobacteriaceae archaeon]